MSVAEIRRLKQLEEENAKLKRLVADLSLDETMLQGRPQPKVLRPGRSPRRGRPPSSRLTKSAIVGPAASQDRSDRRTATGRVRDPPPAFRLRLKDLAAVRCGYRRCTSCFRGEGWPVDHKRVYRIQREEGLAICTKLPRRKAGPGATVKAGRNSWHPTRSGRWTSCPMPPVRRGVRSGC